MVFFPLLLLPFYTITFATQNGLYFCYFNGVQCEYELLAWAKARMWNLFIFDCTCGGSHRSLVWCVFVCVCVYHSGVHFITTELIFNALRHVRLDTLLSIGHYVWVCVHCLWRVVLIQKTQAHTYSIQLIQHGPNRMASLTMQNSISTRRFAYFTISVRPKPIDQPIQQANQNQCEMKYFCHWTMWNFCHGLKNYSTVKSMSKIENTNDEEK